MRHLISLSLLAPALVAQAPAAQTLAQKVATEAKAIEALKAEDPNGAFEKAKALATTPKPAFDKTNVQTASGSIREWHSYIDIQRLVYNTGIASGHFEEAKAAAEKARELAKELNAEAQAPFAAYKATWVKAGEDSAKALDELKEIEAKAEAERTPEQVERAKFLQANQATYKGNVENAKKVLASLERPLKDLEAQTTEFEPTIAQVEKRLADEQADISKPAFSGNKAKYATALVASVGLKPENKDAALVALNRAKVLDPANKEANKYIDYLLGKGPAPKVKPAAKAPAKAKKKGA